MYLINSSDASREGPYVIASVRSAGTYILSLENGQSAQNGEVDEAQLQAA